ncbi:hypothetical protein BXZ70DRAFT_520346 [Cristinia sonorae]|uniref:Uncharacterized protein n=1 Tax=Cristinia sonorae TaxID=1940300 RepID=A0A8K0UVN4_9AGAR|nr:hypothetical protein BXZ70DRAFT_520346 [Cristinia sonorae]
MAGSFLTIWSILLLGCYSRSFAQQLVLVDDSSTQITYTGDWESRGDPSAVNATFTMTISRGSRASLSFEGIQVSLHGAISGVATTILANISLLDNNPQTWIGPASGGTVYVNTQTDLEMRFLSSAPLVCPCSMQN